MGDSGRGPDSALWPRADPIKSGLSGRCPRCGEGKLFSGFLAVGESCAVCGLDYSFADSGDGPAAFVILIVGFLVLGLALWTEVSLSLPLLAHLLIWVPLAIALGLVALRLFKGVLISLQYCDDAGEGRHQGPRSA